MADLGAIGSGATSLVSTMQSMNFALPSTEADGSDNMSEQYLASLAQIRYSTPYMITIDTSGIITGRVFYDSSPLANQSVHLIWLDTGEKIGQAGTNANGEFVFYGLEKTAGIYGLHTIYGSSAAAIKINITPDANVDIGLYSVTARRPLVLINGIITEAPDGTTWAVGVPDTVTSYSANVGDGTNTSYTITHSLGTRDVVVETRDNNSPYGVVDVNWEATTTSAITITFESPPTTNRYRVNIIAL